MSSSFDYIFSNSFKLNDSLSHARVLLDEEDYFSARYYKQDTFEHKRKVITDRFQHEGQLTILVGKNFAFKNWGSLEKFITSKCKIEFLDPTFLMARMSDEEFALKREFLRGKVVLITNHDIAGPDTQPLINLKKFYLECNESIFAGWDWDNHHNIHISSIFALCSDIYFPSQRGYDYEFSRVAPRIYFIMPSAYEWTRDFLEENMDIIISNPRNLDIFGAFNYYGKFTYRNRLIKTLNQNIPEICFIDNFATYQNKSDKEKLVEWCSSKWHWLIPTLNAVSVRAFYALICGTGVILPIEFRGYEEFRALNARDVIWFDERDVLDPRTIKSKAKQNFLEDGVDGIIRRHNFAKENHNLDIRVNQMIRVIKDFIFN